MNDLIETIDNEARVSHRVVAQNTNNQVKAIVQLVNKYKKDFDSIGGVPFKMETLETNGGVQETKVYYFNEKQASFLMTLLRNNEVTVRFKLRLVEEFYKLKEEKTSLHVNQPEEKELLHVILKLVDNQQRQTDAILDLVGEIKNQTATPQVAAPVLQTIYIDSRQRKKLRDAINSRAKDIAEELQVTRDTIAPSIWIELKRFFDVDDYQDLHQSQVGAVMNWVMMYEPQSQSKKLFGGNPTAATKPFWL